MRNLFPIALATLMISGCAAEKSCCKPTARPAGTAQTKCVCEEPNWCCKGCCCAHGKGGDPSCTCSCCDKCQN